MVNWRGWIDGSSLKILCLKGGRGRSPIFERFRYKERCFIQNAQHDVDGIDDVSMTVHVLGVQRKGFPATYAEKTDFFFFGS